MSDSMEIMRARHSVRQYLAKPILPETRAALDACARELNAKSGLNIQIIYDEPACFSSRMAHYGRFENCQNYICMVGKNDSKLDEKCGYYGELLVLEAQKLGLNTCWAALTHGKSMAKIAPGEKEAIVIALGYGKTPGAPRKSKKAEDVSNISADAPGWFKRGVEAALLAPTAVNQQKFSLKLNGSTVTARHPLIGPCLKIDLGIIKCHFELGAGKENFRWG